MRKSTRLLKRLLALSLVLILSIESFAAVVGDNDGAAFITKAEFDSLKNDFQSQIDQYNNSIDNKIDGAISGYLEGIRVKKSNKVENKYLTLELHTKQKFKDLKWTKKTNWNLNVCDSPVGTNHDQQLIYQNWTMYVGAEKSDKTEGYSIKQTGNSGTAASTREYRIELDKDDAIYAWGYYSTGVTIWGEQIYFWNNYETRSVSAPGYGPWMPVSIGTITGVVRRPAKLSQNMNRYFGDNQFVEYNWAKSEESLPSDLDTLNMDLIRIAPLSVTYEGFLPKQPLTNAADFSSAYNTDNYYGKNKWIGYDSQAYLADLAANPTEKYNINMTVWGNNNHARAYYSNFRIMDNLHARWFVDKKMNEASFATVDTFLGKTCSIKAGIPITNKLMLKNDDEIKLIIENAGSNGYLVPYISKDPDQTWDGLKTAYQIDKYRVVKNVKKEINLEPATVSNEKSLFVVWLPDDDCVLPDITIYQVSEG